MGSVCDIDGAREAVCGSERCAPGHDAIVVDVVVAVEVVVVVVVVVVGALTEEEVCRALPLTMAAQDMIDLTKVAFSFFFFLVCVVFYVLFPFCCHSGAQRNKKKKKKRKMVKISSSKWQK